VRGGNVSFVPTSHFSCKFTRFDDTNDVRPARDCEIVRSDNLLRLRDSHIPGIKKPGAKLNVTSYDYAAFAFGALCQIYHVQVDL
jgi:hypothetical protein